MRSMRGRDAAEWYAVGERLLCVNPRMYARLLAMAQRAVAIEDDPLSVIASDAGRQRAAEGTRDPDAPLGIDDYSTDA